MALKHKYKLNWKRHPKDGPYHAPAFKVALAILRTLAPTVDLSPIMGPQLDQGAEGSCGPNTADELITSDQISQGLPVVGASRLDIYYNTRALMGTLSQDSGVDNPTMMKALASSGYCAESLWPYDDSQASMVKPPTPAVVAAALLNKITDYASVPVDLTQVKGTLASRKPFCLGFDCFQQIMSDQAAANGILTVPPAGATPIGGHDVSGCGYTDVDQPGIKPGNKWPANTIRFRNHWLNDDGTPWGDGGYGYMPYSYAISANASDFAVINTVPGSAVPTPTPPPAQSLLQEFLAFLQWLMSVFGQQQAKAIIVGSWFSQLLQYITMLAQTYGPAALPTIELMVQLLPLTADQKAAIITILQSVLGLIPPVAALKLKWLGK